MSQLPRPRRMSRLRGAKLAAGRRRVGRPMVPDPGPTVEARALGLPKKIQGREERRAAVVARIRTIKPSFWESVGPLSHEARLLAVGLISMADDAGRFVATHTAIAGYIYPHEDIPKAKLDRWLREVVEHRGRDGVGMVELYQVGAGRYGWLPKFSSHHQAINRPQTSTLPAPPEADLFSEPSQAHSVNGSVNGSVSESVNPTRSRSESESVNGSRNRTDHA